MFEILVALPNYLGTHIIIVVKRRSSSDFQVPSLKNDRQLEKDSPQVPFSIELGVNILIMSLTNIEYQIV